MSDTFAALCTVAHKAPLSMGFPRQEHWRGLPFPSPGDPTNPGIKPVSPSLGDGFFTAEPPGKPFHCYLYIHSQIPYIQSCSLSQTLDWYFSRLGRQAAIIWITWSIHFGIEISSFFWIKIFRAEPGIQNSQRISQILSLDTKLTRSRLMMI